jgi:hypothetical protein
MSLSCSSILIAYPWAATSFHSHSYWAVTAIFSYPQAAAAIFLSQPLELPLVSSFTVPFAFHSSLSLSLQPSSPLSSWAATAIVPGPLPSSDSAGPCGAHANLFSLSLGCYCYLLPLVSGLLLLSPSFVPWAATAMVFSLSLGFVIFLSWSMLCCYYPLPLVSRLLQLSSSLSSWLLLLSSSPLP